MIKNAKIVTTNADPGNYHRQDEKRGHPGWVISSSALREFFRCPARWLAGYNPPESEAKDYGSLLDTRLLTPEQFSHRYAIKPLTYKDAKTGELKPWNMNANVCKEWGEAQGSREIVSSKDVAEVDRAISRIGEDPVLRAFVEASERQVWVVAEWHDPDTNFVVGVKALLDLVPRLGTEFGTSLGDLKSTRTAALTPFSRACFQMGYHFQAAFHTDLYTAATKEDRSTWCFLLSESYAPFQSGKRFLSQDFMELGRTEYRAALAFYCACLKSNRWPGYDDHDEAIQGWSLVNPEPWMASQRMFAPKMQIENEESPQSGDDIIP